MTNLPLLRHLNLISPGSPLFLTSRDLLVSQTSHSGREPSLYSLLVKKTQFDNSKLLTINVLNRME